MLSSAYGINTSSIAQVQGGFSAKAFRVAADKEYFLKVYDKSLPTIRGITERMEVFMPALGCLSQIPTLNNRVLTPVPMLSGAYQLETEGHIYVLFHWIPGETPGIETMTRAQTIELAEILAALHSIQLDCKAPQEDISLSFLDELTYYLDHAILRPHACMFRAAIAETKKLRDTVRVNCDQLVLCHGDAHGNNVIQSAGGLVLVDFDGLHMAPAEADLFIYDWHPHGDAFLEAYTAARPGFQINWELLRYYILRRRLEDVWVDIQRLTEESPDAAETQQLIAWVGQGIAAVGKILGEGEER